MNNFKDLNNDFQKWLTTHVSLHLREEPQQYLKAIHKQVSDLKLIALPLYNDRKEIELKALLEGTSDLASILIMLEVAIEAQNL